MRRPPTSISAVAWPIQCTFTPLSTPSGYANHVCVQFSVARATEN
jgi:hypothetical protein